MKFEEPLQKGATDVKEISDIGTGRGLFSVKFTDKFTEGEGQWMQRSGTCVI